MELSEKVFQFENNLSKHGSFHFHALLTYTNTHMTYLNWMLDILLCKSVFGTSNVCSCFEENVILRLVFK